MKISKKTAQKTTFPSELRLDLASSDWVIIATGRARRPETFKREKRVNEETRKKDCPFCRKEIEKDAIIAFAGDKKIKANNLQNWTTLVAPNKFPAFLPHLKFEKKVEGNTYLTMNAVGYHEVIVTRDHKKSLAQLPIENVKEVIDAYQERYLDLMKNPFVNYISIFHNHGREAGASISHPHSQLITTPLIDCDLRRALLNSEGYFRSKRKCIYCEMDKWEEKTKKELFLKVTTSWFYAPSLQNQLSRLLFHPKNICPISKKLLKKKSGNWLKPSSWPWVKFLKP